ncbi:MFS transporter [Nonomuraea sp. NPDC052265]|uniref:MFS transporter n=1 Tax=Nonomuraea sp. NPDC052265 TaxID=3364374 RepID=UPI0037C56AD8
MAVASIALMSSSMGIGGALGLPISAAVAEYASWRVLFWGSAVLSVLIAVLIRLLVPPTPPLPREGRSMLAAGLWMAPSGLMMMLVSPLGARLSAARGPKVTLIAGSLVMAVGYGSSMGLLGSAWGMLVVTCVCSLGVGLAYGAMPALIMGAVPRSETAAANSFNTLMRSIGTTVSAAVVGAILSQMTIRLGAHTLPSEAGFRIGMLVGCGAALAAAAVTMALPARPGGRAAGEEAAAPASPARR